MEYQLENAALTVRFKSKGGVLSSIKDKEGIEYLWQGDSKYWSGQAPVLFPICGSIRNNEAVLDDGTKVNMPRHGIVRKEEFKLESKKEDKITFSITDNEKMQEQFPYHFKLWSSYKLDKNNITVAYTVQNLDKKRMPFFIGGHPAFNCPLKPNDQYSDYELTFEKEEDCSVPTPITETGLIDMLHRQPLFKHERTLPLSHELFHKDMIILDQLKSRKVMLCHKKKTLGVELDFKEFPYLMLWSSTNDGPFIALEPWGGLSTCNDEDDKFTQKRNVKFVEPGEEKSFSYKIAIL